METPLILFNLGELNGSKSQLVLPARNEDTLWVSNKTPWVVQLKCVIHHETVYRATVQSLEKVSIFFYYFFTVLAEKTCSPLFSVELVPHSSHICRGYPVLTGIYGT